ncbi:MAG: glycosyltransferase family 2 protein [Muribaculum sp.]|nr:glycosyltransferase family 2 protein [Muribaculum sp.]
MNRAISIIVPAYNAEKYIYDCLTSISQQTFTDFEVIVSNDGSKDCTLDKIEEFKSKNPAIDLKIITNPNGGVSLARKRALEIATGEWITFVDADDTIPTNSLFDLYSHVTKETELVVGFLQPQKDAVAKPCKSNEWQCAVLQGIIPPPHLGQII